MIKLNRLSLGLTLAAMLSCTAANAQDLPNPPDDTNILTETDGAPNPATSHLISSYGIGQYEAEKRIGLQMKIGELSSLLAENDSKFAGIEVKHEPRFGIQVFFSKKKNRHAVIDAIDPELQQYVSVKRTKLSLTEVSEKFDIIGDVFNSSGISYQGQYNRTSGKIDLVVANKQDRKDLKKLLPKNLRNLVKIKVGSLITVQNAPVGVQQGDWGLGGYGLDFSAFPGTVGCTVGFTVNLGFLNKPGLVTAGHCDDTMLLRGNGGNFPHNITLSAPLVQNWGAFTGNDFQIWDATGLQRSPLLYFENRENIPEFVSAGYFNIIGIIRRSQQYNGMVLCKNGAITGITCGEVINNNAFYDDAQGWVQISNTNQSLLGLGGDSGGAVFMYPGASYDVYIAGTYVGSNDELPNAAFTPSEAVAMPIDNIIDLVGLNITVDTQ